MGQQNSVAENNKIKQRAKLYVAPLVQQQQSCCLCPPFIVAKRTGGEQQRSCCPLRGANSLSLPSVHRRKANRRGQLVSSLRCPQGAKKRTGGEQFVFPQESCRFVPLRVKNRRGAVYCFFCPLLPLLFCFAPDGARALPSVVPEGEQQRSCCPLRGANSEPEGQRFRFAVPPLVLPQRGNVKDGATKGDEANRRG